MQAGNLIQFNDNAIADRTLFVRNDENKSSLDREDLGGLQCKYPVILNDVTTLSRPTDTLPSREEQVSFAKQTVTCLSSYLLTLRKCVAFTLAEVLITLGIIGVVASLTIPNVINNHLEKRRVVQLKKAYNTISRAFDMAIAENGTVDNWCTRPVVWDECSNEINNKILPYLQKVKLCEGARSDWTYCFATNYKTLEGGNAGIWINKKGKVFTTSDGVSFNIRSNCCDAYPTLWCTGTTNGYMNHCGSVNVDLNGPDGPNVAGKDYFYFSIRKDKVLPLGIPQDTHMFRSFSNRCLNYGDACAGWVIYNENMDYLHCKDLSWNGKSSCKQK